MRLILLWQSETLESFDLAEPDGLNAGTERLDAAARVTIEESDLFSNLVNMKVATRNYVMS